ncbi:unnamed protein product [Rhizoctonia solani]|uniref:Uncharacterized protein n=1 Tax=Rhizoctonia solani TaxID=456999 RepID=A0A8H3DU09_9AGAM|nr:unnamed protein product [Rhizoctonia solani]
MPAAKTNPTPKASKRTHVPSTRKREADKNAEAEQRERAGKKASAKARKAQREEAADDDVLVGYDGESPRSQKLRARTMELESENQRLKGKLKRRNEHEQALPVKLIPEPSNKIDAKIDSLRADMDMAGEEHDVEWSLLRGAFRALLVAAGLNWDRTWSRQDLGKINLLILAAESKYPGFKRFENHWGSVLLLQECFGNIHAYKQKLARLSRSDNNTDNNTDDTDDKVNHNKNKPAHPNKRHRLDTNDTQVSDDAETRSAKMVKAKVAARRSYERHAAKLCAEPQHLDSLVTPDNDGDTEPEVLPDSVRRIIEREEIGVPATPKLPARTVKKLKQPSTRDEDHSSPSASTSKSRAVIYMRRGRGGKVVIGRGPKAGRGSASVDQSDALSKVSNDEISDSSGQTTSDDEED